MSASDLISKKAREKLAFRQKIKALLEASRPTSIPRPTAAGAAARQLSPKREISPNFMKEVAAAAVLEVASSIASEAAAGPSGPPDDPGVTFDEIYDWKCDLNDVPLWINGPETFDKYLSKGLLGPNWVPWGDGMRRPWLGPSCPCPE